MNLFLIRHPKPDVVTGTCYGSMDMDLKAGWQQDAEQLSSWLLSRLKGRSASYHSPLKRAAMLAKFLVPDSVVSPALQELDFANWEGLLWNEIPKEEIELWANDIVSSAPYQGESLQQLADRVMCWWQNWLNATDVLPDNVILVTHSGVIKVLVSQLCQWPLTSSHLISPDFLTVTELSLSINEKSINGKGINDKNELKPNQKECFATLKRLGAGDWV